jgi:hypothetical protein
MVSLISRYGVGLTFDISRSGHYIQQVSRSKMKWEKGGRRYRLERVLQLSVLPILLREPQRGKAPDTVDTMKRRLTVKI